MALSISNKISLIVSSSLRSSYLRVTKELLSRICFITLLSYLFLLLRISPISGSSSSPESTSGNYKCFRIFYLLGNKSHLERIVKAGSYREICAASAWRIPERYFPVSPIKLTSIM